MTPLEFLRARMASARAITASHSRATRLPGFTHVVFATIEQAAKHLER